MFAHQKKVLLLFALLILSISVACSTSSIPFIGGEPEAEIAPTINPLDLEIMIAEAAATKVAQTVEAIPTNTVTAIPTETPVPSPTPIPPTNTPTEVDYPNTGSELEENEGVKIYTDYVGAYTITLPTRWLSLRPGEEEYTEALALPEASIPEIQASLLAMENFDPNTFRLVALDTREGHYNDGFVSNINFLLGEETDSSLEETFAASVLGLPETLPGVLITSADITITSSGVPVAFIVSERDQVTATGQNISLYQKQALFMVKNHSLVISFTSTLDFKDQIIEDFDAMVDSFGLLGEE